MNGYEIFAAIGAVGMLVALLWGFRPVWDTLKRDLEVR